jgi:Bacterial conjugation TrbI-like protein
MNEEPTKSFRWGSLSLRARLLAAGAIALAAAAWAWRGPAKAAPETQDRPAPALPTRLAPETLSAEEADREAPAVDGGYRREIVRPKPVQNVAELAAPKEDAAPAQSPGGPASRRRDEKRTLPEIFKMPSDPRTPFTEGVPAAPASPAPEDTARTIGDDYAPFGRLVKCQLVNTVDSVTARSEPIVALVTQELDWNGHVIIPAGTEAFSYAKPDPIVDAEGVGRLVDTGEWTLVLPGDGERANGRELILKARAVDRREVVLTDRGRVRSWDIDDGADGLVGYALSTLDNMEVKLFASAAISGMVQGFGAVAERQQPAPGVPGILGATQAAPTLGNALTGSLSTGAADYLNQMAARIREEISRRGIYVRVPAGKAFYLFVEQTIDPRAALIGLRLPDGKAQTR